MEIRAAEQLVRRELEDLGLGALPVKLDNAKRRLGGTLVNIATRTPQGFTFSRHFLARNDAETIRKTVLHEAAHALTASERQPHGPHWRAMARRLGVPPTPCGQAAMPDPPWGIYCRECGLLLARRHRRSMKLQNRRCGKCWSGDLVWRKLNS